jgi:hypothetical protein
LGDSPSVDLVVMAAEAFVDEAKAVSGRITELKSERARVDAALADAEMRLGDLPPLPDGISLDLPSSGSGAPDEGGELSWAPLGEPEEGGELSWAPLGEPDEGGELSWAPLGEPESADDSSSGFGSFESFDSFESFGSFEDGESEAPAADQGGGSSFSEFDSFPSLVPDELDEGDGSDDLAAPADDSLGGDGPGWQTREEHIAELERALEVAIEEEAEYREWVESRDALVDTALQIETVATTKLQKVALELLNLHGMGSFVDTSADELLPDAEAVTAYLHDRIASLRQVSFAGSVPLVLDDALRALPPPDVRQVLADIEPDAALVQIIYLTDDPDLIGWADEVGFERAAVVDAPAAFR